MGIDWLPGRKARPGSEQEFEKVWNSLHARFSLWRKRKIARYLEISLEPYETLGAPIVGKDDTATDWARSMFKDRSDTNLSEEQWLTQLDGLPVLALLPPCDGLPRYTNGGPGQYVEAYSFRAQFLLDCESIIGVQLLNELDRPRLPRDTTAFGQVLLDRASTFANKSGIDLTNAHEAEDPDSPEFRADVVASAGRWCKFWGDRGHWLEPWC